MIATLLMATTLAGGIRPGHLPAMNKQMDKFVTLGRVAGTVTIVAYKGKIVDHQAHGYQSLETKKKMGKDSIFRVYSMTKPVTAAAIMILVEEGKVSLKDPVDKYLLEFGGPGKKPTVQQILTHTAGFSGTNPGEMSDEERASITLGDFVRAIAKEPLKYEPGTAWEYSGPGYAVAGRIVEVASGMDFESFLQDRIFKPLKMKDTTMFPTVTQLDRIADVYQPGDDGKLTRATWADVNLGNKFAGPAGGLYSTAKDMWAFFQMLANGGQLNRVRILSPATVETMTQIHSAEFMTGSTHAAGYGLGLSVTKGVAGTLTLNPMGTFGHSGAVGTYGWVVPKRDLVGIYMSQHAGEQDVRDAFMAMANSAVED